MKLTFFERQYPAYFAEARAKGAEVGEYVRTMGWVKANETIGRAATGWVNRQPLNNIKLEQELRSAYIGAAVGAAEKAATAEVRS